MALMKKDKGRQTEEEKILDVDASMQGNLSFRDPVNLRINGRFEGSLDTLGSLMVGENATVKAEITGESITIAGKVTGNITAKRQLTLIPPGQVVGDVQTPLLEVVKGAILQGNCRMNVDKEFQGTVRREVLTAEELARYLEVETSSVLEWAERGRIPAIREGNLWTFDRSKIDEWVSNERIK